MNERILRILIESFWQILLPGLTMTIPLTILSFTFGRSWRCSPRLCRWLKSAC